MRIGNTDYAFGEIFLTGHQDTALLKEFGFRDFKFEGRVIRNVRYSARWPLATDVETLPEQITGINYATADSIALSDLMIPRDQRVQRAYDPEWQLIKSQKDPYRRVVVRDFRDDTKYDDYYTTLPLAKRVKKADDDDIDLTTKGNFHVVPIEKDPFRRKESIGDKDDPNLGTYRVVPVEEGRYHTKEYFYEDEDPNLGTFRVNPVESGRYHKPQNVGSGKPSDLGTFRTRPDPKTSSLRPTDFGILKKYSTFQTGQSFFTTPGRGSIQSWQRVGGGSRPNTISWQEWQRRNRR
jgi:hypothetical protein